MAERNGLQLHVVRPWVLGADRLSGGQVCRTSSKSGSIHGGSKQTAPDSAPLVPKEPRKTLYLQGFEQTGLSPGSSLQAALKEVPKAVLSNGCQLRYLEVCDDYEPASCSIYIAHSVYTPFEMLQQTRRPHVVQAIV